MVKKTSVKKNPALETPNRKIEFFNVEDIPLDLNYLFYGRSGSGKTTILGTFPKPLLLIDTNDRGTLSIRKQKGVIVTYTKEWNDFEQLYWYLLNGGINEFRSIAIDTTTRLQDLAINRVRGATSGMVSRRVWGETSVLMRTWLFNYRNLPLITAFTAHDRIFSQDEDEDDYDDEDDGMILPEVGPQLMPAVMKSLAGSVDVIGNTFIKEAKVKVRNKKGEKELKKVTQYCMRIGPHARYLTKFRRDNDGDSSGIPSIIVDPTYDKLLELASGE